MVIGCKVFIAGVANSEEVEGDVMDTSVDECSILGGVVPGSWARKDCVAFRVGRGGMT